MLVIRLTAVVLITLTQTALAQDVGTADAWTALQNAPGKTRVLPRHLAAKHSAQETFKLPRGYRKAWNDDRLNRHRAEGTLDGYAKMQLVWTRDVPRRLIDARTGEDVTALMAGVYPYRGAGRLGDVTVAGRDGRIVTRSFRRAETR